MIYILGWLLIGLYAGVVTDTLFLNRWMPVFKSKTEAGFTPWPVFIIGGPFGLVACILFGLAEEEYNLGDALLLRRTW